jgi:hypothetical protein
LTPEDIAARYPVLFHLAEEAGWATIQTHGLLPSDALVRLFEIEEPRATRMLTQRRAKAVELRHPIHGCAVLNDNKPISDKMLTNCLDDGLQPSDWMRMLNARVFFWPSRKRLETLKGALLNAGRRKIVIEVDTLSLARAYRDQMEIAPFNTGSATRKPARRGNSTYTPITSMSYIDWQKKRGGRDTVAEVLIVGPVPDLMDHVKAVPQTLPRS